MKFVNTSSIAVAKLVSTMLKKNPQWTLYVQDQRVFISAGADHVLLADEISEVDADYVFNEFQKDGCGRLTTEPQYQPFIDKLLTLGVLFRNAAYSLKPAKIKVRWAGDVINEDILLSGLSSPQLTVVSDSADCVLLVRTTSLWSEVSTLAAGLTGPHVLLDLAYCSMISIGPFVAPSQTACINCLSWRVAHLWGDPAPASVPNITGSIDVAAGLVRKHLETFAKEGTIPSLVGRCWSLNMTQWRSNFHPVFRLPWCPVCYSSSHDSHTAINF